MDKQEILIEKYLHKELSEDEVKELNSLLASDSEFRSEFELRTIMYADYKTEIKNSLRHVIPDSPKDSTIKSQANKQTFSWWKILLLLGLLAAAYITIKSFQKTTNEIKNSNQLIADYLGDEMKYPTVTKDDTINPNSYWSLAKQQYLSNNYDEFLGTMSNKDLSEEQQYYVGLAHGLKSEADYTQAINTLETIPTESLYKEEANWYLALFYLKDNKLNEAKELLQSIIDTNSWSKKSAEELLKSLN